LTNDQRNDHQQQVPQQNLWVKTGLAKADQGRGGPDDHGPEPADDAGRLDRRGGEDADGRVDAKRPPPAFHARLKPPVGERLPAAAAVARCGGRTIVGDCGTDAGSAAPSRADREAVAEAASLVAFAAAGFTPGSTTANVAAAATGSATRAAVASR